MTAAARRPPARPVRRLRTALATLAALLPPLAAAPSASAQSADLAAAASCIDAIPESAFSRVAAFLTVVPADSSANPLLPAADLLGSSVAARVRRMLGAADGEVPAGEPALGWRDLEPGVRVALHRDGRFTWSLPEPGPLPPDPTRRAGTDSLVRALEQLRAEGERLFWPEGVAGDSAVFRLGIDWPIVGPDGTAEPRTARMVAPVLTLRAPWRRPVEVVQPPRITYPRATVEAQVNGAVVLRFVVDSTGRVDMDTVEDVWPADRPRQRGQLGRHYGNLVQAVTRGLRDATFSPAQVGGCPVRLLVQQPFVFDIRR